MSERKDFILGNISQAIPQDRGCGTPESEVFFLAPIDLLPDDRVIIDQGSGQPLGIYRDGKLIWKFEGHYVSGSISIAFDVNPESLDALFKAMGR